MDSEDKNFIAMYSLHVYGQFSCRIPKVNGKGYLKSALGGHHFNEASKRFYDALADLEINDRDLCDVDGYLSLDQDRSLWGIDRKNDAELLMKALSLTFPRITGWKEVSFDELTKA
jgi:hypothetical protein